MFDSDYIWTEFCLSLFLGIASFSHYAIRVVTLLHMNGEEWQWKITNDVISQLNMKLQPFWDPSANMVFDRLDFLQSVKRKASSQTNHWRISVKQSEVNIFHATS